MNLQKCWKENFPFASFSNTFLATSFPPWNFLYWFSRSLAAKPSQFAPLMETLLPSQNFSFISCKTIRLACANLSPAFHLTKKHWAKECLVGPAGQKGSKGKCAWIKYWKVFRNVINSFLRAVVKKNKTFSCIKIDCEAYLNEMPPGMKSNNWKMYNLKSFHQMDERLIPDCWKLESPHKFNGISPLRFILIFLSHNATWSLSNDVFYLEEFLMPFFCADKSSRLEGWAEENKTSFNHDDRIFVCCHLNEGFSVRWQETFGSGIDEKNWLGIDWKQFPVSFLFDCFSFLFKTV